MTSPTSSTKLIRSITDLAAALDVDPTIEAVSRAIYRNTTCGAWVSTTTLPGRSRARQRRFRLVFGDSIFGPVVSCWQDIQTRRVITRTFADAVPPVLLAYLASDERVGPNRTLLRLPTDLGGTMAEVRDATGPETCPELRWLTRSPWGVHVAILTLNETVQQALPGIAIGSIIEGCDAEAETQSLAFPFKLQEFEDAIAAVEASADEIWRSTHGCPGCAAHQGMEEWEPGATPIDPNCAQCQGTGTVI